LICLIAAASYDPLDAKGDSHVRAMKNGILLELLTELFQAITADDGVTITRRRIFKLARADVAEIDILLEGRFGSSRMKVAVECRDRADRQGKEWIQQIIGKRDDLRSVGIRHWIAVSGSGFTEPAIELAQRAGIELLIPLKVEAEDADAKGPHRLLNFQLNRNRWKFGEVNAEIGHENEAVLERLKQSALNGALSETVVESDHRDVPLPTFLLQSAETAYEENRRNRSSSRQGPLRIQLADLKARLHDVPFTLARVEVDAEPISEVIKGNCRLMTFSDAALLEFMGLIGVNEFVLDGEHVYMLVGYKPGFPSKLIFHARSSTGDPISGWQVQLDEHQLQAAGFQSRPPKRAGSSLLHRLLQKRT
jgi:hypothetical protein